MSVNQQVFAFGPYRLHMARRLLYLGKGLVPLGSRAAEILVVLVERSGQLVTKDELLAQVWPDRIVEENSLVVHVSALRKALGDGTDGTRYITTISGRGYCFVGQASLVGEPPSLPAAAAAVPVVESDTRTGNLPTPRNRLIGREADVSAVIEELAKAPLVTIAGPGGIGKTRLALAVGERLTGRFGEGVWLVELGAVTDPQLVPSSVAAALELDLASAAAASSLLVQRLRGWDALVVLDNCEHVVGAAARLCEALMATAPKLRILATSQEPLRLACERIYRVAPLALPREDDETEETLQAPALQLFLERVRAVDRGFCLDAGNAAHAATICRRLDGIALAIEFAAARAAVLGLETLGKRLDERFRLLTQGQRTALPRHQTLRALLDWSYGLLAEPERIVLRRLGVFADGCTLDAAEAVVADDTIPDWDVAGHVASLIDKSLVTPEHSSTPSRYRLLESTRAFARERLAEAGEAGMLARRHAAYFHDLSRSAEASWETTPCAAWRQGIFTERENLRAALDWCFGPEGDAELGLGLTAACFNVWRHLGAEGLQWNDRARGHISAQTPHAVVASIRFAESVTVLSWLPGRGLEAAEAAVEAAQRSGIPALLGAALTALGAGHIFHDRLPEAKPVLDEARLLLEAEHHPKTLVSCLGILGIYYLFSSRPQAAVETLRQALALARSSGYARGEIRQLGNLIDACVLAGAIDEAIGYGREAVPLARRGSDWEMLGTVLANLSAALIERSNFDEARAGLREAVELLRPIMDLSWVFDHLALLAAAEAKHEAAAQLVGYADGGYRRLGVLRQKPTQLVHERTLAMLTRHLDVERLKQLRDAGEAASAQKALRLAELSS